LPESFDAYEYLEYLGNRWRVPAIACVAAGVLAIGITWLLPNRYTATASILIEPPGTNDIRMATAISPIYLESLKTYERFAASDSLFARAMDRFRLQTDSRPLESLKKQVLKVSKLRDTKILEISVSLTDPVTAQKMVQYLAEETVGLSRNENLESDRDVISELEKQLADSQKTLDGVRKIWTQHASSEPVESLQAEIDGKAELLGKLREQMVGTEADVAEYQQRDNGQLEAAKARAKLLETRVAGLEQNLGKLGQVLALRSAGKEQLQMELKTAQGNYDAALNKVRELRASAGMRGERLRVIDPGIVPQRPSSPNLMLNLIAAVLGAFIISLIYLSIGFSYQSGRESHYDRVARHAVSR
jgi:uncharacterized protein involved in exopolysaccharide biosynthesis